MMPDCALLLMAKPAIFPFALSKIPFKLWEHLKKIITDFRKDNEV